MFGRQHELRSLERSRWLTPLITMVVCGLGALALFKLPQPWKFGVPIAGTVAILVGATVRKRRLNRIWRELLDADRCRCVRCFQDLRGLGERGTCPECGKWFILRETREEWLRVFQGIAQDGPEEEDSD